MTRDRVRFQGIIPFAVAMLLTACGASEADRGGKLATFRGEVARLDSSQAHVDGPFLLVVKVSDASDVRVYLSSCEGQCSRAAVGTFQRLVPGTRVELRGLVGADGDVAIFEESTHTLRVIEP